MTKVCKIKLNNKTTVFCLGYVERWKEHCSNPYNNKIMHINLKNDNFSWTHQRVVSPQENQLTWNLRRDEIQGHMELEHLLTWGKYQVWYKPGKNSAKVFNELLKATCSLIWKHRTCGKQRYKKNSNSLVDSSPQTSQGLIRKIGGREDKKLQNRSGRRTQQPPL